MVGQPGAIPERASDHTGLCKPHNAQQDYFVDGVATGVVAFLVPLFFNMLHLRTTSLDSI